MGAVMKVAGPGWPSAPSRAGSRPWPEGCLPAKARRRKPPLRAPRGARERALLTVERLKELYPAVTELDHRNAFEMTIATILSAQTTDRAVNSVTPVLFERYPTAVHLAAADVAEV